MTASLLRTALLCAAAASWLAHAAPDARRFAVVVGSNHAATGRQSLRYAHQDARSVANALRAVSDFPVDQVKVLLDPEPGQVLAALDDGLRRLRAVRGETLLLFYYSGHADVAALYPGGNALPLSAVRARLDDPAPTVRVGIIDACRGGGWTQAKGLTPEAPFEIQRPLSLEAEGSLLIASSSGLESAHETEALEGSFFTHHFVAGLLGAADQSGDGEVTAQEAFRYARALTVRDTALQAPQPQHPSFDVHLRGRNDLALARVTAGPGTVTLRQARGPLQILSASSGIALLELPPGPVSAQVTIPAGRYLVVRRSSDGNSAVELTVDPDRPVTVEEASLRPTELTRLGSKGPDAAPGANRIGLEAVFYLSPRTVNLHYERALSAHWSVFAKPSLGANLERLLEDDEEEDEEHPRSGPSTGVGVELGGRLFPFGTGPRGPWLSAAAGALFAGDSAHRTTGVSVNAGYTVAFWNHLELSLGGGVAYLHTRTTRFGALVVRDLVAPDVRLSTSISF